MSQSTFLYLLSATRLSNIVFVFPNGNLGGGNIQEVHICMSRPGKNIPFIAQQPYRYRLIRSQSTNSYLQNIFHYRRSWKTSLDRKFYGPIKPKVESGLIFLENKPAFLKKQLLHFIHQLLHFIHQGFSRLIYYM